MIIRINSHSEIGDSTNCFALQSRRKFLPVGLGLIGVFGRKTGMNRFRILIADDNDLIRRCIADLIRESEDMSIVGEASDGSVIVDMAKQLLPDAVIMDVNMPRMDGLEASRAISSECPQVRVIGLSMYDKSEMGERMLNAGAVAYFSKTDPWDELIAGIHKILGSRTNNESLQLTT